MPAPPKGGAFLWWRYSFRLKYKAAYPRVTPSVIACGDATFPKGTAEPSQSRLTACQLPRGGSFISAYRQMRKSSPFGGAGAVAPERVGHPLGNLLSEAKLRGQTYLFVSKSVRNAQDGCFSSVVPVYWIRFPIFDPALDFKQESDTFLTRRNRVLRPLAVHPIQTTLWNKC